MSQQNQPPKPANPFAPSSRLPGAVNSPSAPTGSRFGGASAPPASSPPPAARPGTLTSRLPTRMDWRIIAVEKKLVRFDMDGLGDPFHRLLGKRLMVDFGDPAAVSKAMEAGGEDVDEIAARLDTSWSEYELTGAVLVYRWKKDLRHVLLGQIPPSDDEFDDSDGQPALYEDDQRKPPAILRALDMLLVLNVLARTRANILLKTSLPALTSEYLQQSLYTDDPRLIALAQATGCIEETVLK
jgi:hypothetical protein